VGLVVPKGPRPEEPLVMETNTGKESGIERLDRRMIDEVKISA
jgi:hypothetical protein